MVSRDQADKAAESLLHPSKKELTARQQKVARRRANAEKINKFIPPAAAAISALALFDYFRSPEVTVVIATVIGWTIGSVLDRNK